MLKFDDINHERVRNLNPTHEERSLIIRLYKLNFRRDVNKSCSNCIFDAYLELRNLKKQNKLIEFMESAYKLKQGAIVIKARNGLIVFNRHTITDELAEIALKENPGLIKYFERYPDDWQERCGFKPAVIVEDDKGEEIIDNFVNDVVDDIINNDVNDDSIGSVEEVKIKRRGRKKKDK